MTFCTPAPIWILAVLVMASVTACRQNLAPGRDVIDANAAKDFTESASGLKYQILRLGSAVRPTSESMVRVHYEGTLDDGTVFDSSYKMGMSASFVVDQVIPGWTEGLQYIGEGGMIKLTIPPQLAYGAAGFSPDIPPNATLHFTVELIKVE
jgi:FKBP-type peptidyl-prolyl cis-trans isomerase